MMTIIKSGFILIVFLFAQQLNAQLLPIYYDTLSMQQEIVLDAGVDYYGSAIQRELTSKFIRGGFITNEIKDNSYDRHQGVNRFGGVGLATIEYRNYNKKLLKNKDWGFVVKAGYNAFFGAIYSKDLFGLAMYGNDRYLGETLDASGSNITAITFQKVGFGMIDVKSKSNISFNVYNVNSRFKANLSEFEMTQDLNGDSIQFAMAGKVEMGNNSNFNQGIGFGLDLDFKIPFQWGKKNKTSYIQFQVQNLGFAYMYEKQKVYEFDTSFVFSGLKWEQITGDEALFSDTSSVLDSLGIRSYEKNRTTLLPGFIQIGKIVDELSTQKVQSFFGIRMYPTLIYSPFVYAGVDYKPIKWLRIGANASYGGFGKFRAGLYSSVCFGKYSVGIATENIVGFVTKKSSGQSLFLKLRWVI